MKKLSILLSIAFLLAINHASGQTGSVVLKDGTGTTLNTYNSVTAAHAAIPATVTQAYTIELQSAYTGANETYPITFTAHTGASTTNTLTLRPAAGVGSVSISTSYNGPVVLLSDIDYMIIDGRAGGTGTTKALTINNTLVGASTVAVVRLLDGATFNTIRYCNIQGIYTGSNATGGIHISSSTNPTGNSDNLVEYCTLKGSRNLIYLAGSLNKRNVISNCDLVDIAFAGIWSSSTGKLTVDKCKFYSQTPSVNTSVGVHGILFDSQADTVIFTNNQLYDLDNGTNTTYCKAFVIRSVSGTPYFFVANNMISIMGANATSSKVTGIEFSAGAITGKFFHNTVRIGGAATSGSSAPISKLSTVATSALDIFNNIFINERTGGSGPHYAIDVTSTAGAININYNTYAATGTFANLGGTAVPTFALYQAALLVPNEGSSNTVPVQFVSNTDLHLTGTSIGNTALTGTLAITPPVTTDIDNQTRTTPYRGADEALPLVSCSGTPAVTTVTGPSAAVCTGVNFTLNATGQSTGNGITYRWQSRPAATGAYTYITGATAIPYTTSATQNTQYRLVTTCATSGLSDTSNAVTVNITPLPTITSISETHVGAAYSFTANGVQNATSYSWNFGDGSPVSTATAPSYTYPTNGVYTVTLTITNSCGSASQTLTVTNLVGCTGRPNAAAISSNATNVCANGTVTLTAVGHSIGGNIVYQWQSRPLSGGTYTSIPGATTTPYIATVAQSTQFRLVTICTGSGLADTTAAVPITANPLPVVTAISETHVGGTYDFTATGLTNVSSYSWSFGDNSALSTNPAPTHAYATNGTYTVRLVVSNPCGTDTAFIVVTVTLPVSCTGTPAAATLAASVTNACNNIPFSLNATGQTSGTGIYYKWQSTTAGGSTWTTLGVSTNPTFVTSITTARDFRMVDSCATSGLTAVSNVLRIGITPQPVVNSITYTRTGLSYTFTATGVQNATGYTWDFGDNTPTASLASPTHLYAAAGIYNVKVTVFNNCGSAEQTITINTNGTGTGNVSYTGDALRIYPNPATDMVYIEAAGAVRIQQLSVINQLGMVVQTIHDINTKNYQLATSQLPAGNYLIRVETSQGPIHKKLQLIR
jgi:PKD repeat protein